MKGSTCKTDVVVVRESGGGMVKGGFKVEPPSCGSYSFKLMERIQSIKGSVDLDLVTAVAHGNEEIRGLIDYQLHVVIKVIPGLRSEVPRLSGQG